MLLSSDRADRPRHPKPLERRLGDEARFIRTWLENPATTGAVSPSSPFLARAMAEQIDPDLPGPIVELGPGTGPVTQALLRRGLAPERLILVEFDAAFCELLEQRFPGVRVVRGDAFALSKTLAGVLEGPAAAIVSSLPLLNTPEPRRLALLAEAFRVMSPDGVFVQFTYGVTSPIPCRSKRGRARLFAADCSAPIWLNLPPARVWTYSRRCAARPKQQRPADILLSRIRRGADRMRQEFKLQSVRLRADLRACLEKANPTAEASSFSSARSQGVRLAISERRQPPRK
ncbi:MAG TPA: methyltransferase domain-containing protein [Beijerinckiaceae bacterium]|nr:methyltransferase domain-containing protein [Beijerinckiaceae bacterium]